MMGGRPNFNHPFARAVIDRVKESLVVYQQRMKGIVVSVSADGKSAVVRRYEESPSINKKPYVNTVSGLAVGDEVVCMVDRGGGVITGVVGGKAAPVSYAYLGTGYTAALLPESYPAGISAAEALLGNGWPVSGNVVTIKSANVRTKQIVFSTGSDAEHHRYAATGTSWSAWVVK